MNNEIIYIQFTKFRVEEYVLFFDLYFFYTNKLFIPTNFVQVKI